ncbi:hypothetical protein VIGAN_10153900, partial [Vigna angularis var. angularis]
MLLAPASLPALVSVPGCHMPTSFRLVRPRTTPYWERLGSDTICNVPATHRDRQLPPQITTRLSSMLCPHSHTFWENFPEGHPSQNYSRLSTLNHGVLMSQATEKQMHFGDMSSQINSFKLSFNRIVPYLYSLQIPLIPVYVRFIHVPLPPEAARSRSLSVPPAPCFLHRRH